MGDAHCTRGLVGPMRLRNAACACLFALTGCTIDFDRFVIGGNPPSGDASMEAGTPGPDAGRDARMPPVGPDASPPDGGPMDTVDMPGDGGRDGASAQADAGDASTAGDAGPVIECLTDDECGDPRVFACLEMTCALRRLPQSIWVSGGGGSAVSGSYSLRVSAGAIGPAGQASSANYAIRLGGGGGRP